MWLDVCSLSQTLQSHHVSLFFSLVLTHIISYCFLNLALMEVVESTDAFSLLSQGRKRLAENISKLQLLFSPHV